MRNGALYIRGIPKPVKLLFKAACARREESMTLVIESMMKDYIENPEKYAVRIRDTKAANNAKPRGRPPITCRTKR